MTTSDSHIINETTEETTKCTVLYQDEQARAEGTQVQSRHSTVGAAVRFINRVLAVRHTGPFRIVPGHVS